MQSVKLLALAQKLEKKLITEFHQDDFEDEEPNNKPVEVSPYSEEELAKIEQMYSKHPWADMFRGKEKAEDEKLQELGKTLPLEDDEKVASIIANVAKFAQETEKNNFGGKKFSLPSTHIVGMIVPKGGSSCANCKFGETREDGPHCKSTYWIEWNSGESRLPIDDPETYCSDFWEPVK